MVVSSPTIVCKTPMFPLSKPPMARPRSATQIFSEKPTTSMLRVVPKQPMSRTGLRPMRSERPPHHMPMAASHSEKAEMSRPA